jgi:GNAT superfamily N-acetyltransferase
VFDDVAGSPSSRETDFVPDLTFWSVPLDAPAAAEVLAAAAAELVVRYEDPGAAGAALDPAAFAAPVGTFLLAGAAERVVGCGGLRTHAPGVGEIKRMYVAPHARGRGVARRLLAELEAAAVGLGMSSLVLETGDAQPEALALYASSGWEVVPSYGEFACSPRAICLGKQLEDPLERPA